MQFTSIIAACVATASTVTAFLFASPHPAIARSNIRHISTSANTKQPSTTTSLAMTLTLYGSRGSRSPLVNWAAAELNIPLSMAKDLSKNPHPFGQIPCLTDDTNNNAMVFESGAILIYLQSIADGKTGSSGESKKTTATVTSWVAWANASLDPVCFLETPEGKVYDTGLRKPNKRIEKLNQILSTPTTYLVNNEFSLADVAVSSYLLYVVQFFPDVELYSKWPNVVRYMKDCASRVEYANAFGDNVQSFLIERLDAMMMVNSDGKKEKKMFGMF